MKKPKRLSERCLRCGNQLGLWDVGMCFDCGEWRRKGGKR